MSGAEIRNWRTAHGMTQTELAKALHTTATTVSRWEQDIAESPPMLDLALAQVARLVSTGIQAPQSPFEVNLFARYLREHLARWADRGMPLQATPGAYQGDGTWLLTIEPRRPFDWDAFFGPQIVGRCWLESDDRAEPVGWWSVPTTEYGPAERNRIDDITPLVTWQDTAKGQAT